MPYLPLNIMLVPLIDFKFSSPLHTNDCIRVEGPNIVQWLGYRLGLYNIKMWSSNLTITHVIAILLKIKKMLPP